MMKTTLAHSQNLDLLGVDLDVHEINKIVLKSTQNSTAEVNTSLHQCLTEQILAAL